MCIVSCVTSNLKNSLLDQVSEWRCLVHDLSDVESGAF